MTWNVQAREGGKGSSPLKSTFICLDCIFILYFRIVMHTESQNIYIYNSTFITILGLAFEQ